MIKFVFAAVAAICAAQFSFCFGADEQAPSINEVRAKFIAAKFESELRQSGILYGAVCIVQNGKVLVAENFDFKNEGEAKARNMPLGRSSLPLVSLLALSMERAGLVNLDAPIGGYCSLFRIAHTKSPKTSLNDMLSARGGFDTHADTLVPPDSNAMELFDVAAQIPTAPHSAGAKFERSDIQAALAGYVLGYAADKAQKNMKKSFAAASEKYLFGALGIEGVGYRAYDKALFAAYPYSMSIDACAKWLALETSPEPTFLNAESIAARRVAKDGKFANGWLASQQGGASFFLSGDYFEGVANIIAVFPYENAAAAFFAATPAAHEGPRACAAALSAMIEAVLNPPNKSVLPLTP